LIDIFIDMKKNFLKEISEEEKNFILEMHIRKGYNTLNEENIFEDENQDVYNSLNRDPSARNIARVIRNSNGGYLGDDKEAWAEAAFNKISDINTYNDVSTMLGQDVVEYLEGFLDIEETFHSKSIASHYNTIKKSTAQNSDLKPRTFTDKTALSLAKTFYKSSEKNKSIWQMLLLLNGANLGYSGPNGDGVDGDFGTLSKKALKNKTGSSELNFDNFNKLFFPIAADENKLKKLQNFIKSGQSITNKDKNIKKNTDQKKKIGEGFIIPFAFPTYTPKLQNPNSLWDQFLGIVGRTVTSGGESDTYGVFGHGGIGTVDSNGNVIMFEFGRYEGAKKGYGITRQKNVGVKAKIIDGKITNVNDVVQGIKKVTYPPGPSMTMDYLVLSAPNIVEGITYAKDMAKLNEKKYEISDFSVSDDDANCGTFAVEVARVSGAVTSPYCFPTPNAMITQLATLNNVIESGTM
jgi:hypothetical protein